MKKLTALVTMVTVTLSGCAMQQGDFPSLQKRAYEDESTIEDTAVPVAPNYTLPADLQSSLNAAMTQSSAAYDRFKASLPTVKRRVDAARGAAVSSESWVVAQMELAALEMERSPSIEALADIDALYREQLGQEAAEGRSDGTAIIARQREIVQAQVDSQQAEIDAMKNRLR